MKVLFDQNIPTPLRESLFDHEVHTALDRGWDQFKNGQLMAAAEEDAFDCMITADQSIFYQQNNAKRRIALIVLNTNYWRWIQHDAELIRDAVARSGPGTYELVMIKPRSL